MPRLQNISKYCVSCRSGRVRVVEGVAHAHALDRLLLDAVDRSSARAARAASRTVGATSITWWNWLPHLALGLDARSASARSCRCACRPSARRPASSTGTACPSRAPSRPRSGCTPSGLPNSSIFEAMNSVVSSAAAPLKMTGLVEGAVRRPLGARAVVADDVVDRACRRGRRGPRARRRAARRGGRCARGSRRRPPSGARARASGRRACRPRRGSPRAGRSARSSAGTTPSSFWRANVSSRSVSQPWSNLPLYFADHSSGTWCGACVAPGAK